MSELSSFTTDCSRQFSFRVKKYLLQMFVLLFVVLVTHGVTEGDFSSLVKTS